MKKLLYLLLLTPIIYLTSCSKSSVTPEVESLYGCMDSLAFNYDTLANTNDSSCCYVAGCTDPIALNYDANACSDDGSCIYTLAIGVTYQGGIVFWLDGNGGGLIAAPSDFDASPSSAWSIGFEWGCYGTDIIGADGTAIGTGAQNTIDIETACSASGTAADICANLTLGGYSDWFLPSKDELNEMFFNLHAQGLGNFASNHIYWSSSEVIPICESDGESAAWMHDFYDGKVYKMPKFYEHVYARPVRAF